MRRLHLIELHEQPWYPASWRKIFQRGLGKALTEMGGYRNLAGRFGEFLQRIRATAVLDMCSGSAEPLVDLWQRLEMPSAESGRPALVLSDLYPDPESFQETKDRYPGLVEFYPEPVDALRPPAGAPAVRTLFTSLHHFRPDEARTILEDAARHADGIAVFESTGRTWKNMAYTFLIPFGSAFITIFRLRPFSWWHVVWGLLLPVVPFTALFDGLVSNFRTYKVAELEEMTRSIDGATFRWEIGTVEIPRTGLEATYLFGWKRELDRQGSESPGPTHGGA